MLPDKCFAAVRGLNVDLIRGKWQAANKDNLACKKIAGN
jgi:hypothetical protein